MKRLRYFIYLLFVCISAQAQTYKFYYSNQPKVVNGNNDTLKSAFSGGMNAPQFSNIDYNNDGKNDLFIFDRSDNKVMAYTWSTNGFIYTPQYEGRFPRLTSWAQLYDYNNDGKPDILTETTFDRDQLVDSVQIYPDGLRILKNISTGGKLDFKATTNALYDTGGIWPPPFSSVRQPSAISTNRTDITAIGDLDNDGDLDMISYDGSNYSPNYYENFTKNKYNIPHSSDTTIFIYRDQCWGYMQYDANAFYNRFNLHKGKNDLASCQWQMYGKKKHAGTTQLMLDYNGDGVKDIIYGDISYKNLLLLVNDRRHNSLGRDSISFQDSLFPSNTHPADFIYFPAAYYADINADGKGELLVTTNGTTGVKSVNNVWTYHNTGTQEKPVFDYAGNNFFGYDESIDVGYRSAPSFVDIDGDGDKDLMISTSGDYDVTQNMLDRIVWYENLSGPTGRAIYRLKDTNFLQLTKDTLISEMYAAFGDLNGDSKPDMVCGNSTGTILYYTNQSSGGNYSFTLSNRKLGGLDAGTSSAPALYDLDHDGLLDLIIGNQGGYLQYYRNTGTATAPQFGSTPTIDSLGGVDVRDTYYSLDGNPYINSTGYSTPYLADLDNNGKPEIIVGAEGGKVALYKDADAVAGHKFTKEENLFVDYSDDLNGRAIRFGLRAAPALNDMDGDGKADIVVGTLRGGLTVYASTSVGPETGVDEANVAKADAMLYPNPASDVLTILSQNFSGDATYAVYNVMGQKMLGGNISRYYAETAVPVSSLPNGMYFVTIEGESFKIAKRVMIGK